MTVQGVGEEKRQMPHLSISRNLGYKLFRDTSTKNNPSNSDT